MALFKKKVTANDVLTVALGEVGYAEKPVNITKYGAYFNMQGAQWCGLFVQWVWTQVGWKVGKDFPYTYYTPAGASGWTKLGKIKSKGTPKAGDQLFFNIPNDNLDRISHTGFFVKKIGNKWLTIEGNTSGPVHNNKDPRNGGEVAISLRDPSWIVCWADVPYTDAPTPIVDLIVARFNADNNPAPAKTVAKKAAPKVAKAYPGKTISSGEKSNNVKLIQKGLGFTGKNVDGDFGPVTKAAVVKFQTANPNLGEKGGIVGPNTWKALVK